MARRRLFPLVLLAALLLAGCSDDDPAAPASSGSASTADEPSSSTSSSTTETSAPSTTATTAGGEDGGIPLTGPTGSGSVTYSLAPERSEFCYQIRVEGIGEASEAVVRRTDGEVVLALQPPVDGAIDTCAATDALLIQELQAQPANFTVEVKGTLGTLEATLR